MKTFTLAGQLESYRSLKDRSLKLSFETQEATPEMMVNIQNSLMKVGFVSFSPDPFTTDELKELDSLNVEYNYSGKSPSQRLRAVLYRAWEQNSERYEVFNDFYIAKMEKFIDHIKSKLA